jgi:hypothetical protein
MNTHLLLMMHVKVATVLNVGAVRRRTHRIAALSGGMFEGPRLGGTILPGSADWQLLRSDGVLEMDLRFTLETDDRALISMVSFGPRHGPPEVIAALGRGETVDPSTYYFRTMPRLETAHRAYSFLNRLIAVVTCDRCFGHLRTRPEQAHDQRNTPRASNAYRMTKPPSTESD